MPRQLSSEGATTVYSPEVFVSGLLPGLDSFLAEATGLKAGRRFLAQHDAASIQAFYPKPGATAGGHWPLIADLYEGRLVCVTEWQGEAALSKLQAVKGATQPALADPDSVRGRFWCDNPVCNLLHVSDDPERMAAELRILDERRVGSLDLSATRQAVARPRHSALLELTRLSGRLFPAKADGGWHGLAAPIAGDARAAAKAAIGRLLEMAAQLPSRPGAMIGSFLAGDPAFLSEASRHLGRLTAWEAMVLECGLHSTPLWLERLGAEAAATVGPAVAEARVGP